MSPQIVLARLIHGHGHDIARRQFLKPLIDEQVTVDLGGIGLGAAGRALGIDMIDDHLLAGAQLGLQLGLGYGLRLLHEAVEAVLLDLGRDMVGQGNKLIFGTTFGYMEPMLKVATDAKDVKFEHATGYKQADNIRTYDSRTYEGAYMAGVIAGGMSKSGTLGVVGSIPIPEVIRNINSFTLGAQSVNPKIKTKVVWVNEWFNPPKETEAAQSLINGGADVLFQGTDSPAVLKTAQEKGKRAVGWDSDMVAYGPKAHLGSAIINWTPYYTKTVKDMLDGTWTSSRTWWGVKEGAIDLVSIAQDVPADTRARLDEVKKGLKDGSFAIWKGPLKDNAGKEILADGAVADDKFLGGINYYVQGVEGKVPGGDGK